RLGVLAASGPRAPRCQGAAAADAAGALAVELAGRRAAWSPSLGGLPVEPAQRAVLEASLPAIEALGVAVEPDEPDLDGADEAFETWRGVLSAASLGPVYDAG